MVFDIVSMMTHDMRRLACAVVIAFVTSVVCVAKASYANRRIKKERKGLQQIFTSRQWPLFLRLRLLAVQLPGMHCVQGMVQRKILRTPH